MRKKIARNLKTTELEEEKGYVPTSEEKKLKKKRKDRIEVMLKFKEKLGIDAKCNRMDALFTPHYTELDNQNNVNVQYSDKFDTDDMFANSNIRKSMPLAFEKITTAQALLIDENPRGVMQSYGSKYKDLETLQEHVYYENFKIMRKKRVMRKYSYHLAKYGLGYVREYIKKCYKKEWKESEDLNEDGTVKYEQKWVYDINDVVSENIHPHHVILDNNCLSVKDVNRPARDLGLLYYYTQDEFAENYPEDLYPKAKFIKTNQEWLVDDKTYKVNKDDETEPKKIQCLEYENRIEGTIEKWANQILVDISPLNGGELSISGGKWVEDREDYDGIGIGQIIELYQPLVDDIMNADNERMRQLVRPSEDFFNGAKISDESDDMVFGSGRQRKIDGSPDDVVYNKPPVKSSAEFQSDENIQTELDRVTFIPRNLGGTDDAKTAYQSAQNRESALKKLGIPLDTIKDTIEDCANLDMSLYPIVYGIPEYVTKLMPGDDGYDEAMAIFEQNPEDERVVVDEIGQDETPSAIYRRKFKEYELPLAMEIKENKATGRIIATDEKEYWEMVPKHFNWKGHIEIIAKSFLPVSKAYEDEQDKLLLTSLMETETTNDMGQPTLMDASGQPFTINKVAVLKNLVKLNERFNVDEIIVPMNQQNVAQNADQGSILNKETLRPGLKDQMGLQKPELKQPQALSK